MSSGSRASPDADDRSERRGPGAGRAASDRDEWLAERRVLLASGDVELQERVREALGREGARLAVAPIPSTAALDPEDLADVLADVEPHALLLDLTPRPADSLVALLDLREAGHDVPIVLLATPETAREGLKGLWVGADDCMVRPVNPDELVARIHAVLRRQSASYELRYGDVRVDLVRRRVQRGGRNVALSPREYDLLLVLLRAKGEAVSREILQSELRNLGEDSTTNVIDVHIGRLRKKLDRHGRPFIRTVRGTGYQAVHHPPGS